jgi:hypothetical protein
MVEFLATDLSDCVAGAVDPDRWRTGEGIIPTREPAVATSPCCSIQGNIHFTYTSHRDWRPLSY